MEKYISWFVILLVKFIGSTCKKLLSQRLAAHVSAFKKWKEKNTNYISSIEILKENNYYIELLELVPCNSKDELLLREKNYINNNDCVNKRKPIISIEEKKECQKEYNEKNKEKIKEYVKEYNEKNIDKIKERKKDYDKKNKEKNKEYAKEYYKNNIEHYIEQRKRKYICEHCNEELLLQTKPNHEKTLRHLINSFKEL